MSTGWNQGKLQTELQPLRQPLQNLDGPLTIYQADRLTTSTSQSANIVKVWKKLLKAAIVKAWINAIHAKGRHEETKPIGSPISFSFVNPNKVIVPQYDALVLTLCIIGFDVHRVLIDPGSATDLLQLPVFKQMKLFLGVVNSAKRIHSCFNGATTVTLGEVTLPVKARPVTQ